jgi:outer membrane protein TolC
MKIKLPASLLTYFFLTGCLYAQQAGPQPEQITLDQVIGMALERNFDVILARNTAESYATDRRYANGAFLPQLNAQGAITWNNNEQSLRFEDAARNNSGKAESKNTAASVALNWTLFDGTRMFATLERIKTINAMGQLAVKDQMVNTIANIITGYYDIVRQKQQLKAILEQMAVSEERVKLADRKLQVGTGGKPELLQARVDYNAQRTQALQQEAAIVNLKEQLNTMVGQQLPPVYEVADTIVVNLELKLEDIQTNIETTNFALQTLNLNTEAARLSLHERRAEMSPVLAFNAAYNWSETNNTRLINPFSSLFSRSNGYNYGFTLTLPILNNFVTRRNIQQANIFLDRQRVLYSQAKVVIDFSVRNAYVNYDNARRVLLVEEENILFAKENVYIALEGFKRGIITYIELRTAQQSLADAYNRLINARYLSKAAETELLRLKGALLQ